VPELRALAAASHTNTRFWSDERFAREDCAELYAIWIEKSVQGNANVVFVGEHEGRVAGYFTCLLKPDKVGEGRSRRRRARRARSRPRAGVDRPRDRLVPRARPARA
jgi:hypothetical protein